MSTKSTKNKRRKEVKLDEQLVFARFNDLAIERESLYNDYIEIDEPAEIGSRWVEFSAKVVKDLLSVVDLTKRLFERRIDEMRRSSSDQKTKDFDRIKNLTDFWLELSMLGYLYATIEKRGVLDQPGIEKISAGYMDTKKSLDDLTILAFQSGHELFNLEARLTLGEVLALDQEKKRLDFYDIMEHIDDEKYQLLGLYDQQQAGFLMTRVSQRLVESAKSWWWKDAIGIHSASDHAISHILSMVENWRHSTSDVQEKGQIFYNATFPISKVSSDVALAQHFKRLGMSALRARANEVAAGYFEKAADLTASLGVENLGIVENLEIWERSIPEQYLVYIQISHLGKISCDYAKIMQDLAANDVAEIKKEIPEIIDQLNKILSQGDLAYISSVAVVYETVLSYILEQLENDVSLEIIQNFVDKRMAIVIERLHNASHQIAQNWLKIIHKPPIDIRALKELVSNIDLPLMAIYILPPKTKEVISMASELIAIQNATEALSISSLADKEFGNNPVKEMLMRAKTYQLSKTAWMCFDTISDRQMEDALSSVLEPLSQNALLRGLIAEVQLRTSVLQFRFINTIVPLIENSSLTKKELEYAIEKDDDELNSFKEGIQELHIAAMAIEDNKAPINIGGSPLNWNYIGKLRYYSQGLIDILDSLKNAIKASYKKTEIDDQITSWDEAKGLAYKAADLISKAKSSDSENLAEQIYSLGQIYNGFENNARSRKEQTQFPVDGIVELLQALIMTI